MEGEKRKRSKNLANQLQDCLADAEALQHQKNRGEESYVSQCKLVSARLAAIQKLMSKKENSALAELKAENEKLKQANAALKLEIETLKAQPVEPAAPTPTPTPDPIAQDEEISTLQRIRRQRGEGTSSTASRVETVAPAPTRLPSISGIPEHMMPKPVPLTPPCVEDAGTAQTRHPAC